MMCHVTIRDEGSYGVNCQYLCPDEHQDWLQLPQLTAGIYKYWSIGCPILQLDSSQTCRGVSGRKGRCRRSVRSGRPTARGPGTSPATPEPAVCEPDSAETTEREKQVVCSVEHSHRKVYTDTECEEKMRDFLNEQ